MSQEEVTEALGGFDPTEHADEAEQRWGDTAAYKESARRTGKYGPNEYRQIKAETDAINQRLAALLREATAADSEAAMDAVESHRQHIERWFYPCTPQMQIGLGQLYITDARFQATYEELAPGLAQFVHDAIVANAQRLAA